jgi:hypothetical protein
MDRNRGGFGFLTGLLLTGLELVFVVVVVAVFVVVRTRGRVSTSGCACPLGTLRDSRMEGLYVKVAGEFARGSSSDGVGVCDTMDS